MISEVYAMGAGPNSAGQAGQAGGMGATLFPMAVVMLIFYFILIRPQKKREQQHRQYLETLKKGDEVLTQSGLYGRIAGITNAVVTLEVAPNTKIKITKSSIAGAPQVAATAVASANKKKSA